MYPIEQLSEVDRIPEADIRTWMTTRMEELSEAGVEVCFWILEPNDETLTACAQACWGQVPDCDDRLDDILTVIEYVEEQPTFFAAVVPTNHDAGSILILPKSAPLDPVLRNHLVRASVTAV